MFLYYNGSLLSLEGNSLLELRNRFKKEIMARYFSVKRPKVAEMGNQQKLHKEEKSANRYWACGGEWNF
jgi:hypothetical protein